MFEEFGNLGLSREQFRELLLSYVIAMHIRRRAAVLREEEIPHLEDLERHLLSFASGFEADDLVERTDLGLYPAPLLDDMCHDALETRDNEEFWSRLEEELAFRDWALTLSPHERAEAEKNGAEPPAEYYEKYRKEIEEFGVDRLTVDEKKKALE